MKTSLKIIYNNLEKVSSDNKVEVLDPYKNPEVKESTILSTLNSLMIMIKE